MNDLLSNRFIKYSTGLKTHNPFFAKPFALALKVVKGGVLMDPFYRSPAESPHPGYGRSKHFGADITGPTAGDGSIRDPRRGTPVYATINTILSIDGLNTVKAYNKSTQSDVNGLNINGSGNARMTEAKIHLQPWIPKDAQAYGGVVGINCIYSYTNNNGSTAEFSLYVEYLHLITPRFLPKDKSGKVATADEWANLGRGIGFGVGLKDNDIVDPSVFLGPSNSIIGYLGATETPHVHVQVGFSPTKSYGLQSTLRIDPMAVIY